VSTLVDTWRSRRPSDWDWTKLRFVARVGTGHTPDRNKPEYWVDCDIPWVTAADLSSRTSAFEPLMDTAQQVSELGVANSAAVVHPPGTVMFCRTASIGLFCITGREMATTQAFVTWTAGECLDPRYLLYVVAALGPEFDRLAYGSTHMTIYMPDLEAIEVPVPPLEEQRRIADFLDDQITRIDSLIALERQQVDLLAELLRALITATVTGASGLAATKAEPRPGARPRVTLAGALAAHAGPRSWQEAPFRDCFAQVKDYGGEHLPLLGVSVATGVRAREADDGRPAASEDLSGYKVVAPGDIIMNALGKPHGSIGRSSVRGITSPAYWVLRCREGLDSRFAHHLLRSSALLAEYNRLGKYLPPNQFDLSWDAFRSITVALPPLEEQRRIADFLDDQVTRFGLTVAQHRSQADLLNEYRRSLITAAVTGELDVATAERGVPA
jgi:type I restriction enzyme S subunit